MQTTGTYITSNRNENSQFFAALYFHLFGNLINSLAYRYPHALRSAMSPSKTSEGHPQLSLLSSSSAAQEYHAKTSSLLTLT